MPDDESGSEIYLSDLSERDKPWDEHRFAADQVQNLYRQTEFDRYAERMWQCSRWLEYALAANDRGEFEFRLKSARFCRLRHCPICQWRRSRMWRARFLKALPAIAEDFPTVRWVFLTLTVPNCSIEELRETLKCMGDAWNRFSRRKSFPALGWIRSVEITRGKDGSAHPHYHCLLMVPASYFGKNYLKQAEWSEMWRQALRVDYTPIVNIKAVRERFRGNPEHDQQITYRAICETLKYSVKEADLVADPAWLAELTKQLHKTRAIAIGGVLRQYLSEDEPEDLINVDEVSDGLVDDDDLVLWFTWRQRVARYAKTERRK